MKLPFTSNSQNLRAFFIAVLCLVLSAPCFASGYHVYDWKGPAKEKQGKTIRKSSWQPGFVVLKSDEQRIGEIEVMAVDGRVTEVEIKGDGQRKKTYAIGDLKDFGLLLSIEDLQKEKYAKSQAFGAGTLELSDGQKLEGWLGAVSFDDGQVYSISYAADRNDKLTSYFSQKVNRAVMTINGIEMEYQSDNEGFSKIPTLAEYRTFNYKDDSRNPHDGNLILPDGEVVEGQVMLFKDVDFGETPGAMIFYEDGYGVFWNASELSRVTQVIGQKSHYWRSYGASLERLELLAEYSADKHRDSSRNAHPGDITLRDNTVLSGSVAFAKTKDDVNSIEVLFFNDKGIPYSYNGSDVIRVTQTISDQVQHYFPYKELVFVELLAEGKPFQIHANPFPEREDQFKSAVTRGLLSVLSQVAASQLGQESLGNVVSIGTGSCADSGSCSSRDSLRYGVESMVPDFKKDEFVFRRVDQGEVVLFKKNFDDALERLQVTCPGYAQLSRKERKKLQDFKQPGFAVSYLNACAGPASVLLAPAEPVPFNSERGSVFEDKLKNGLQGPSMVVVPAGSYDMGDLTATHANEIPVHQVTFEQPFAISRYEVTLREFDRFTTSTGRVQRTGQLSKQSDSPVRGIAWIDAVAYAEWLSVQTGSHYRLPTEAEWEYAARGEATTAYPWGDSISKQHVRCMACGDKKSKSEKVGQFPKNGFGLFDVAGGVWEWTADCWHPEFSGAPDDGSAWMKTGDCNLRVLRGGSISSVQGQLRTAFRTASNPIERGELVGFRVVRQR
jgi:formylglycine-generating enzyme required for sulfatase activity